jgi:hypothetical protein
MAMSYAWCPRSRGLSNWNDAVLITGASCWRILDGLVKSRDGAVEAFFVAFGFDDVIHASLRFVGLSLDAAEEFL